MSTAQTISLAAGPAAKKQPRSELHAHLGTICLEWWSDLNAVDPTTGDELQTRRRDAGAIARLRRIGTIEGPAGDEIDTAYAVSLAQNYGPPPYRHLHSSLKGKLVKWSDDYVQRIPERPDFDAAVAVVAATLARVREHKNGVVARLLGAKKRDDAPLLAEARFKRLIRTATAPDLLDQGRRIVMLLGGTAPVDDLGASLLLWNVDPYTKRRWSFAYYEVDDLIAEAPDDEATDASPAIKP